jgi:hypothetical protein
VGLGGVGFGIGGLGLGLGVGVGVGSGVGFGFGFGFGVGSGVGSGGGGCGGVGSGGVGDGGGDGGGTGCSAPVLDRSAVEGSAYSNVARSSASVGIVHGVVHDRLAINDDDDATIAACRRRTCGSITIEAHRHARIVSSQ